MRTKAEFFLNDQVGILQSLDGLLERHKNLSESERVVVPASELRILIPDLPKGELDNGGRVWKQILVELDKLGWKKVEFKEGTFGNDYVVFS